MEMDIELIDLRTKQDVINYIEEYADSIEVPTLEEEDYDSYIPLSELGLSVKEVVDILFDANEEKKNITHTWYTDYGDTRVMLLKVGEVSYFEYEHCYDEPDYPYICEITKDRYFKIMLEKKNHVDSLERKYLEATKGGN